VPVVQQIAFGIRVGPDEPQRELEGAETRRVLVSDVVAKRLLLVPFPDGRTGSVGDEARRVEVIDVMG
jgi:hypothetical protein